MKKLLLSTFVFFALTEVSAQVGINTTTPNAQLDIRATSTTTPSNTDGLLIPKVDVFPATNPTAAQQGMLVYLTTTSGTTTPGFYYWDNPTTTWISLKGNSSGWQLSGNTVNATTDFMGSVNNADVIFKRNNLRAGLLGATNTSFGLDALNPASTGIYNTASGVSSLQNNTTGSSNTASGYYSLRSNTTGYNNTASGVYSLGSNITGYWNTASGVSSLEFNTTGSSNTASGFYSLGSNTTGYWNTASGVYSLYSNTTGTVNTASGVSSLYSNTTGYYNTASGVNSLYSNTTGNNNTGLGYNTQTGGSSNVIHNATAVGARASATTSNSLVLGSINGTNGATADTNVGIGTTAPLDRLHVVGNIRMVDGNQAAGKVLTSDGNGTATWQTPTAAGNNWALAGNTVNATTDFMGSVNNADVIFKRNNLRAGLLGATNTSFGLHALNPASTGNNNTGSGFSSLGSNTTGISNTASGVYSLGSNTTGISNTASGVSSLLSNTTGSSNTASGVYSLLSNTTGNNNTGSGFSSLRFNTTGNNNTGSGFSSLYSNTTGSYNTGLGYNTQTGSDLTNATAIGANASATTSNSLVLGSINGTNGATADTNVGIGTTAPLDRLHVVGNIRMVDGNQAAGKVLTSDGNGTATWQTPTAAGNNWALAGNTVNAATDFMGSVNDANVIFKRNNLRAGLLGATNTSFGLYALNPASTGNYNTASGLNSLRSNTTGIQNTATGVSSLYSNTTGGNNTATGVNSLSSNTTGSANTASGGFSLYYNTIGNYNTASGVNSLSSNTTGNSNTASGASSLLSNTTGINNTASGVSSLQNNTTGSNNTGLGYNTQTGTSLTNATAIGANASATTSNSLVLGSINGTNGATADTNVGIGTTAPSRGKLEIVGGITRTQGTYAYYARSGTATNTGYAASGTGNYSIYATERIAASEFNAFSDSRIKNIKGISNSKNDLKTIAALQITDYTLKDEFKGQGKAYKKVIAQQVKEVYPQAVTATGTEIIPDIYKLSEIKNGWIPLKAEVKVGDKVKLIFSQGEEQVKVEAVSATAFKVNSEKQGQVFVFGKEVHDFHTVDYEALSTLNISATQELLKRIEEQDKKLAEQSAAIAELKDKMEAKDRQLSAEQKAVNQRLNELERMMLKNTVLEAKGTE